MTIRTNAEAANRNSGADRTFQALQARAVQVPSRYGRSSSATPLLQIQIIGGNLLNASIESIQYAASVTPPTGYDPATDTVFPTGLGVGVLWTDHVKGAKVLVRHNYEADQSAILSGRIVAVVGTSTIVATDTSVLTVYEIAWL